ncbi:MAG: hypothetical protein ACLFUJ_15080 [Phycisphaerae bacterium]
MDELDVIRKRVSELLQRGMQKGLSEDERAQITSEVNMLWSRLANASKAPSAEKIAN